MTISYSGLKNAELWKLHRQWEKSRKRYQCEGGHPGCGCTTEITQDGIAPCHKEVEQEIAWRSAPDMEE